MKSHETAVARITRWIDPPALGAHKRAALSKDLRRALAAVNAQAQTIEVLRQSARRRTSEIQKLERAVASLAAVCHSRKKEA